MRALSLLLTGLLAACTPPPSGNGNTTGTSPTSGTYTTAPTNTNTQPLGTNYGSLMFVRKENQKGVPPSVELAAIFPTNDPGFHNLAQCAMISGTCLPQVPPDEDEFIDIDPERIFDGSQYDYSFAGTDVGLGPLRAWYQNGEVPHYYANYTAEYAEEGFDGHYGIKIGGEWGDYEGWDDILVSPHMNMMSHFAGQHIGFHDGQTVVFEWEPRGEGEVYMMMNADNGALSRAWLLEDDGYFELDVDDLGLGYDEIEFKFQFQRWNTNTLQLEGGELDVVALSEVAFSGTYFFVGGREEMIAADTCGDTNTMDEYGTGQYWGRLQDWGYNDDMDPWYGGCTNYQASGEEGFVRFELDPATILSVTMQLNDDDAALYLVRDCNDDNTCVAGSDQTLLGEPETVQYFNGSDEVEVIYAALDGWTSTAGLFYADVTVNPMPPPPMHDTCADALAQTTPIQPGGYHSTNTAYTNQLDPFDGGCLSNSAPGPDAMTMVEVPPGALLTVNVQMENNGDPSIYLVGNCQSTVGCVAGADFSVGTTENMSYTNTGTTTETLYIVVDSKTTMEPFFLTVAL